MEPSDYFDIFKAKTKAGLVGVFLAGVVLTSLKALEVDIPFDDNQILIAGFLIGLAISSLYKSVHKKFVEPAQREARFEEKHLEIDQSEYFSKELAHRLHLQVDVAKVLEIPLSEDLGDDFYYPGGRPIDPVELPPDEDEGNDDDGDNEGNVPAESQDAPIPIPPGAAKSILELPG